MNHYSFVPEFEQRVFCLAVIIKSNTDGLSKYSAVTLFEFSIQEILEMFAEINEEKQALMTLTLYLL